MNKFVLTSCSNRNLKAQFFRTFEDAYTQMIKELKEIVESFDEIYDEDDFDSDYGADENSAWSSIDDEDYDWLITEIR